MAPRGLADESAAGEYLDKILKQLVIPFFIGKDARDLENLLWELYRTRDNYKLYGLALWSPQAWVEFAILDMLGRIAGKSMGALLGDIVRQDVAVLRGQRQPRHDARARGRVPAEVWSSNQGPRRSSSGWAGA